MSGLEVKQLSQVIRLHAARYPLMEPSDAVKLVYQSVFGGGHMITDTRTSFLRLSAERTAAGAQTDAPFVEIGNGRVRMHLASAALSSLPDALLNRMFVLSVRTPAGDMAQFQTALAMLSTLVKDGLFYFGATAFEDYLCAYIGSGCPMVRHSETYRQAYCPSYRVVDAIYAQLLPVIEAVQSAIDSDLAEVHVPLACRNGVSPERIRVMMQTLFGGMKIMLDGTPAAPSLLARK